MHTYFRAIGFSEPMKNLDRLNLLDDILNKPTYRAYTSMSPDSEEMLTELRMDLGDGYGIAILGIYDEDDEFDYMDMYPYMANGKISTTEEITIEPRIDGCSFAGVVDDLKLGMTLIFRLRNVVDYIKATEIYRNEKPVTSAALSALSVEGTILMPIMKTEQDLQIEESNYRARNALMDKARSGNEDAVARERVQIRPGLRNQKAVRPDGVGGVGQPVEKAEVLLHIAGIVARHSVEPEAGDPDFLQPETQDELDLLPDGGIVEVQVGHGIDEAAFVVHAAALAEPALRHGTPVEPAAKVGALVRRGALKPGVLARAVVDRQIEDDAHPARMRLGEHGAHIRERSVFRVDIVIIRHIVFVVAGGGHDRHEPDPAAAERGNIVELFRDAAEIADPIPVAVVKRADEDLIPGVGRGARRSRRQSRGAETGQQDKRQQQTDKPFFHGVPPP